MELLHLFLHSAGLCPESISVFLVNEYFLTIKFYLDHVGERIFKLA